MNIKKNITFLLIGILIGTILGNFLFKEIKAVNYDEIFYLEKICNILSSIESDLGSIDSGLDNIDSNINRITCSVNWIRYWIKYCSGHNQSLKRNLEVHNENPH